MRSCISKYISILNLYLTGSLDGYLMLEIIFPQNFEAMSSKFYYDIDVKKSETILRLV